MTDFVYETHLDLPGRRQGKVRDLYRLPAEPGVPGRLLIIASDRMSAYDVVMPTPFPGKGCLLTEISLKWFDWISETTGVAHHIVSTNPDDVPATPEERAQLAGRIMIGRACRVIPIECVARGYLAGSGWKEYQKSGTVCGIALPDGLKQCDQLPEPIFTPATKEDEGHDENITFERAGEIVGVDLMTRLREITLDLYHRAATYARERGIIIADTKLEFGMALDADGHETDELILIDEVFTPDSSRFWPISDYEPGRDQDSFDKQYVRNYLEGLVTSGGWDKTPPGPEIPQEIVTNTLAKYVEARDRLWG